MSQQNVQSVKNAYAAFKQGNIPELINTLSPEIEWITPGTSGIPQAGTHRGHDGVGHFFQMVGQTLNFTAFEPQTYVAEGDVVMVTGYYEGTVKTTGKPFKADWAMSFTFRNGKVVKFEEYTDTAKFVEAYSAAKAA